MEVQSTWIYGTQQLGAYDQEESAARAYNLAALKIHCFMIKFTQLLHVSDYEKELEIMQIITKEEYLASLRRRSSGFSRGVSKYRGVARHHHNGTQEEAAHAYDIAAIEYKGINARQPEIHLFATRFREQNGDVLGARAAYQLVAGNAEKSREILAEAFEHVELSKAFLESHPKRFDFLEPLVEKFIVPNSDSSNFASATDKEELSSIFIEEHVRDKKAHADEFLALEKAKMAKSYSSDPSATQAAYPNAQNQWVAAGYGTYYAG
ncbi:hypothetical protein ACFE04_006315 [Oxalis oulophora]